MEKTDIKYNSKWKSIIILIIGFLLFLVGIYLFINKGKSLIAEKEVYGNSKEINKIIDSINQAKPVFEIGYCVIAIDKFKEMLENEKMKDNDLLAFPVFQNDITRRINIDSPSIHPDFSKMKSNDVFLTDFFTAFKKKGLKLREVNVGCLIIKQIGKGKSDSLQLEVSNVQLNEPLEMYDGTDIGTSEAGSKILEADNTIRKERLFLGNMNTGSSILVPLYITNLFDRIEEGGDPPGWEVVSNSVYIPSKIAYFTNNVKDSITLDKVLSRPINMR